jgi:hypothetical protein
MSQEIVQMNQQQAVAPFGQSRTNMPSAVNAGSVAIEQERAIAEAQGQLILAKKFPRDVNAAYAELMEACRMPAFAATAFYSVPRAGSKVSGPSIRLAEEIARCYGNFQYGHRELGRNEGKSEVEVYAWDMEKNNRSIRQITVQHTMDTREGPKKLRDQKDVDDKIANVASKQVRGRILALVPKWMVESAIEECRKTLAGGNDEPISVRVRKMTQAFAKYGVTSDHLERHLGHKLDDVLADELVDLMGVFNAIKEGTPASDFFGAQDAADNTNAAAEAIKATAKAAAQKASAAKVAAETKQSTGESQKSGPVEKVSNPVKETPHAQPLEAATENQPPAATDDGDVF